MIAGVLIVLGMLLIQGLLNIWGNKSEPKKSRPDKNSVSEGDKKLDAHTAAKKSQAIISPLDKYASKTTEAATIVKKRLVDGDYNKIISTTNAPLFSEEFGSDYNKPLHEIIKILSEAISQIESNNSLETLGLVLPYHFKNAFYRKYHERIPDYFEGRNISPSRSNIAKLIVVSNIDWGEVERAAVHMFKLRMIDVDFGTMSHELEILRGVAKQWFRCLGYDEFAHSTNYYGEYGSQEIIKDDSVPVSLRSTDKSHLIAAKELKNYSFRPGE